MLKSFKSGARGRRHGKGVVTSDEEPGARPTRHIHEFLALGTVPNNALDDESAEKMKWVDLVALNTPGIYINSSSPTTPANATFVLSDRNNLWASALLHEQSRCMKFLSTTCRIRTGVIIEINKQKFII